MRGVILFVSLITAGWAAGLPLTFSPETGPGRGVIGINISSTKDFRFIESVAIDSPAAKHGLRSGDYIIALNGRATSQIKNAADLTKQASGAPGSWLTLTIKHVDTGKIDSVRMQRVPANQNRAPSDFDAGSA